MADPITLSPADLLLSAICTAAGIGVMGADRYGPAREACERFVESVRAPEADPQTEPYCAPEAEGGCTCGAGAQEPECHAMHCPEWRQPEAAPRTPSAPKADAPHGRCPKCHKPHEPPPPGPPEPLNRLCFSCANANWPPRNGAPSEEGAGPEVDTSEWTVPPVPERALREKLADAARRIVELEDALRESEAQRENPVWAKLDALAERLVDVGAQVPDDSLTEADEGPDLLTCILCGTRGPGIGFAHDCFNDPKLLRDRLASASRELEEARKRIAELRDTNRTLDAHALADAKKLEAADRDLAETKAKLATVQDERDALRMERDDARRKHADTKAQMEEARRTMEHLAALRSEKLRLVRAIRTVPTDPIYTLRSRILAAAQGVCEEHGQSLPCGACDGSVSDRAPQPEEVVPDVDTSDWRVPPVPESVAREKLAAAEKRLAELESSRDSEIERRIAEYTAEHDRQCRATQERIAELEAERDRVRGHGDPCAICGEPCSVVAGDPGQWPLLFAGPRSPEPGVVVAHHVRCVQKAIAERDTLAGQMRDATAHIIGLDDALAKADRERDAAVKRAEEMERVAYDRMTHILALTSEAETTKRDLEQARAELKDARERNNQTSAAYSARTRELEQARAALESLETRARAKARQSSEFRDASTTEHDRTVHSAQSLALWQFADEIAALSPAAPAPDRRITCPVCHEKVWGLCSSGQPEISSRCSACWERERDRIFAERSAPAPDKDEAKCRACHDTHEICGPCSIPWRNCELHHATGDRIACPDCAAATSAADEEKPKP